jgi:hypothetical protein
MLQVQGNCDPRFAPVKDAFARNFAEGLELGASFCATVDGVPVVDIWAGDADERGTPRVRVTFVKVDT